MRRSRARRTLALVGLAALLTGPLWAAFAEAQSLDRQVEATLKSLYETTPAARELARTAKGILVFPEIARDNYVLGLQTGHGALLVGGKIVAHYTATSVIYGSQAGVLPFGYALFLVTDAALNRLNQSGGWEVGKDAGVHIMPAGTATLPDGTMDKQAGTMDAAAGTMTNRTKARGEAYAFVIGDTSIMTGVGVQGWKIIKAGP
jgi:lipid-binding SYLF domain-containing protein